MRRKQDFRELMKIPDNYKVLFLQGGASTSSSRCSSAESDEEPCGRLYHHRSVGKESMSRKHSIYGKANAIASSEDKTFTLYSGLLSIFRSTRMPIMSTYCENNTIYGTKFHTLPEYKGIRHLLLMSSCMFRLEDRWTSQNTV